MAEQPTHAAAATGRRWWLAVTLLSAIVLIRAAIFVFWERSHFDSDQAITGLMAKHLAEGRALPMFFYGQNYILGVEAWLAAPLFVIAGASVTALKLPLLVANLAVAFLLFRMFTRDVYLAPLPAAAAALFFAWPAAGTAARLVAPDGGNVEPFLYILLIWLLRDRPGWCGVALGVGFLQREFTLYGFLALLALEAVRRDLFTGAVAARRVGTVAVAAAMWAAIQLLMPFSSAAGPGTTIADVYGPGTNLGELAARSCIDPATIGSGLSRIASEHWPTLFGTASLRLTDFGIVTNQGTQGGMWGAWLLGACMLLALVVVLFRAVASREIPRHVDGCLFLILAAIFSVGGYVVGRCGAIDFYYTRYELLSLLGAAGIAAWFLATVPHRGLRVTWLSLAALWFGFTALPHLALWNEYVRHPPEDIRRTLIAELDARNVRYAASRYWVAYAITFLADERIIVKSSDFVRIREYERIVDAHASEMIRIERDPCPGGEAVMPRVYFCR